MEISETSALTQTTASSGKTLEERITALNRVLEQDPENADARRELYETMQQLLRKDAFLAYQGETNVLYKVRTPAEFQFIHPKDRVAVEPFPPSEIVPTRKATNWLGWSLIGLIPAGLGTLFCAPLAMLAAFNILRHHDSAVDRRRALVVLFGAMALWLVAFLFFSILILHLV